MSDALVAGLARALGAERVVETHISWVLLAGAQAWKLKKPLVLPFLDAGTPEARRALCTQELRVNRRLAPQLYLDVVPIFGTRAAPRLDDDGRAPIDAALRMRRFADGALFDERLAAGTLAAVHVERLAERIAALHAASPPAPHDAPWGTPQAIAGAAAGVLDQLAAHGADVAALRRRFDAEADRLVPLWRERRAAGRIREGHGDLHLANCLVLDGDEVTAFDAIEFDAALRWIDPLADVAFLVMDLWAHDRADLAFRALNAWLDASGDHDALPALGWHLVERALVRALVQRLRGGAATGAPDYLGFAQRLAQAAPAPRLAVTSGVSGSGKSFVALALAERAHAVRLRADVERKRLHGLRALEASGGRIYAPEATERTYARLRELAHTVLAAGWPAIVDAACLRRVERDAFRAVARAAHVPFALLACEAPEALLRERVRRRQARGDDPSEADVAVLERQLGWREPLAADERAEAIVVDATAPPDLDALAARWLAAGHGTL